MVEHIGEESRRNVLRKIGVGSAGLFVSSGAAAAKREKDLYRGIAYDAKTQTPLGNVSADITYPNDSKVRGKLEFTPRENCDKSRLKGEIPKHAMPPEIPWEELPDRADVPSKQQRRKNRQKQEQRIKRKSINLLKGKVPVKGDISGSKRDGERFYTLTVNGRFNKLNEPSMVKINDTGGQMIGEFQSPNGYHRVAFTLLPPGSKKSRAGLMRGLNDE